MEKKYIIFILIVLCGVGGFFFLQTKDISLISPLSKQIPKEKVLLKYTFDNLQKTKFQPSTITLGRVITETDTHVSQTFYYMVPGHGLKGSKRVSGLINIPKASGTYPVIVMIRGFVPDEIYQPGVGTQHAGEFFADNGYITLAPDFLGFAESDPPATDSFEDRFQTYTTTLSLLASIQNLNSGMEASYSGKITADSQKIGIWAHSNGGHIALSVLAISGKAYPTVLWAPVSKSFPYSILYYTDESDDQGKMLRKALANFEVDYNTDKFSPPNYYTWIKAPIEIHQGENDHEVPVWWSDDLVTQLKKDGDDVTYFTYPNADHNMTPGWDTAIQRSLSFYIAHLK